MAPAKLNAMNCKISAACTGGFTLVEVLVAVAILAVGLAAVFLQINQSVFTASYLRDSTVAQWVAVDRITELRLERKFPEIDSTGGEINMGGQSWRYTTNISQTPLSDIRRIDVTVSFTDTPERTIGKAVGFIGRPGAGPPITPVLPPRFTEGNLR